MKHLFSILFLLASMTIFSQNIVSSKINQVKVYKRNAEIQREALAKLNSGNQEIILTNISPYINPNSLQVQLTNSKSVTLLSAKYQKDYLNEKKDNPEIEQLKIALETKREELLWINDQRAIYKGMEEILSANKDLGGNASFTPAQVINLVNSYKNKQLEIKKELIKLKKEEVTVNKEFIKIQKQLNELNSSNYSPTGNIILQLSSKVATNTKIRFTYIVSNTGWNPLYDLRSGGIEKNVQLKYKANVFQNTGIDWQDTDITISTGNPIQNNNRPILSPLYANVYVKPAPRNYNREDQIEEIVVEPLADVKSNMMAKSSLKKRKEQFKDGYNYDSQVNENQLSAEFKIQNKQTIKSDGKEQILPLDSYELDTEYVYHTVPKKDKGVYLLAKVSNWSQYNLVSGSANLFFEGAYVGKSYINTNITSEELLLSLGRDNNITVNRESLQEYTSSKFVGSNKKETFAYEISIKNKKNTKIDLEILDQIPVSRNKSIEIELLEKSNAEFDNEIGKLLWKLQLNSGESKTVKLTYSVKYPKKETVTGIK